VFYTDGDGIRRVLPTTMSLWYNSYVQHPHLDCERFHNKFSLVGMVKESKVSGKWREGLMNQSI